ncbi:MAG: hypothetical protein WD534_17920 [Phycisphaeraceae bacterium]
MAIRARWAGAVVLAGAMVAAMVAGPAWGGTYHWVGGSEGTQPADPSLISLFDGQARPTTQWSVLSNWEGNDYPGEGDTVWFQTDATTTFPRSNVDRTIHEVHFEATSNMAYQFTTSTAIRSLGLQSGRLHSMTHLNRMQLFAGNIVNFQPGVWDVNGLGTFVVTHGFFNPTGSFTKTGNGRLELLGMQPNLMHVGGATIVAQGRLSANNLHTSGLIIGGNTTSDPVIMDHDANFNPQAHQPLNILEIKSNGVLNLNRHVNVPTLSMAGGGRINLGAGRQLTVSHFNLQGNQESWIDQAGPDAHLVVDNPNGMIIAAGHNNHSLRIDTRTTADSLTMRRGILNFSGSGPNNIGSTVIEGGTIDLRRTTAGDMLGSSVDIRAPDAQTIGRLRQFTDGQLANNTTMIVRENGSYQLGANQTLAQLTLAGGGVTSSPAFGGSGRLTLTGTTTPVIQGADGDDLSTMSGNISLSNQAHAFDVAADTTFRTTAWFQNGTFIKRGAGSLHLYGPSARVGGPFIVEEGTVALHGEMPVRTITNDMTVGLETGNASPEVIWVNGDQISNNASMTINRGSVDLRQFHEHIATLNMTGGELKNLVGGQLTLNDAINFNRRQDGNSIGTISANLGLNRTNLPVHVEQGGRLNVSGKIVSGSLAKTGNGELLLSGGEANALDSATVEYGTLTLGKSAGTTAVDRVAIGRGVASSNANVVLNANNQIDTAGSVAFNGWGELNLNGHNQQVAQLSSTAAPGRAIIRTGNGTLRVSGSSTFNNLLDFAGDLHLMNGTRTWIFNGDAIIQGSIRTGTFRRAGSGEAVFHNVVGTSALELVSGNSRISGSTEFAGFRGYGDLRIHGTLVVESPNETHDIHNGTISGEGMFFKLGQGTQALAGDGTFEGDTYVQMGRLHLNHAGGSAIKHLTVNTGAAVRTNKHDQFANGADVAVQGTLELNGHTQNLRTLDVVAGTVTDGTIQASHGIFLNNGTIEDVELIINDLNINDPGLRLTNGSLATNVTGDLSGTNRIDGSSTLVLNQATDATAPALNVDGSMQLHDGSHLVLNPAVADADHAMIKFRGFFFVDGGSAIIDLSNAGPLANGAYRLLDYSEAPATIFGGVTFADLNDFETIAPLDAEGSFSVDDNTLIYTAVPEPGTLALLMCGAVHFLVGRPRRQKPV